MSFLVIFASLFAAASGWHLGKSAVDIFRSAGMGLHRRAGLSARSVRVRPAGLFQLLKINKAIK